MKRVLVIGSGGREHSLGWKLGQSDIVSDIFYSPGNAGTCEEKGKNIFIDGTKKENFPTLFDFVTTEDINMIVVGPEQPLVEGIVDYFNFRGYNQIFGTSAKASLLEADKFLSFDLMNELNIPQADSVKCYSTKDAIKVISERANDNGIVIKARGLTAGKGVSVCNSKEEALMEIINHSSKYGEEVLISERLYGQEFSVFGISDGKRVLPLEISLQDHKRLQDGDTGPNTGGMGAYGPVPIVTSKIIKDISDDIMTPIVKRMKEKRMEYKGFIYGGIIMTAQGPKVIEFNVRFGDPECQPAMMLLKSDLYEIISSSLEGKLNDIKMEFNPGAACCVVLASTDYPDSYKRELPISYLDEAGKVDGVKVFHAGTKKENGRIFTNGGRVLGVTGYSKNGLVDAQSRAYEAVEKIFVPGGFSYRKDIGNKSFI